MDYSRFEVEDFVTDEFFIQWVKSPSDESNSFWNAFLSKNQHLTSRVQRAREIVLFLDFKETPPPEGKFLELWERISQAEEIQAPLEVTHLSTHIATSRKENKKTQWYFRIAASLAIFLLLYSGLFLYQNRTITITTAFGEARTLFLPDSTKVTLNSNSTIQFSPRNFGKKGREVQLNGEAFFSVVHKLSNENFIVKTNELEVEVLGTRFNVNSRRGNTKVLLEEGKVNLHLKQEGEIQELIMKPGDWVEYSKAKRLTHKIVNPNDYLSWRNNRLVFVSTSLGEIAQLLEDNYGYNVIFQNEELKSKKFTGSASSEDVQDLLKKLAILFELTIETKGNELVIHPKENEPLLP